MDEGKENSEYYSDEGSEMVMGPDGIIRKKRAKRRSKNDLHG